MGVRTLLLWVAVVGIAASCDGATLWDEGRPAVKTDLELTASGSDTGNWTANLGDMEVKIEHRHEDTGAQQYGIWTLDVARTMFETQKDDKFSGELDPPEEDAENVAARTEKSHEESEENTGEYTVISKARDEKSEMDNEIPVDEGSSKQGGTQYLLPLVGQLLVPREQHGINTHVQADVYNAEDRYVSDEVTSDPDNFEYFKGVGWFKLDDRHLDWSEARNACAEVGAHLAVPDTLDRVNVFLQLFQRHSDIPANAILRQQVYVGVSDPRQNRQFTTVQGMPFAPEFPIWFHNEPDNAPPGEYCVTFHIEGRTRDVPCLYKLPFFCEKDVPVVI